MALGSGRSGGRTYEANKPTWKMCPSEMGHGNGHLATR